MEFLVGIFILFMIFVVGVVIAVIGDKLSRMGILDKVLINGISIVALLIVAQIVGVIVLGNL